MPEWQVAHEFESRDGTRRGTMALRTFTNSLSTTYTIFMHDRLRSAVLNQGSVPQFQDRTPTDRRALCCDDKDTGREF
jgi:hypothetical protein